MEGRNTMAKGRPGKHFLIYLVGLLLIAGQFGFLLTENAYGQTDGAGAKASGETILAFTSDVHNKTDDVSADRVASWIDEVQSEYGKIDAMGFCGDMMQVSKEIEEGMKKHHLL